MIHGRSYYGEKGKPSLSLRPQISPVHHGQYHLLVDGMDCVSRGS